jgi:hypothetical protein
MTPRDSIDIAEYGNLTVQVFQAECNPPNGDSIRRGTVGPD